MADLFSFDPSTLGALDRAVGGRLIITTEYMVRVVHADYIDLMVGGIVGTGPPYVVHVIALNDSKEIVLDHVVLDVETEMDEPTKLAALQVCARCMVERAERQKRMLEAKGHSFDEKESQNRMVVLNRDSKSATPPLPRKRECVPDFGDREINEPAASDAR